MYYNTIIGCFNWNLFPIKGKYALINYTVNVKFKKILLQKFVNAQSSR